MTTNQIVWGICLLLLSGRVHAQGEDIALASAQRAFYSEQEATLVLRLPEMRAATVANISLLHSGRTLLRRSFNWSPEIKVAFAFPPLKPGIVADTVFTVSLTDKRGVELKQASFALHFFAKDENPVARARTATQTIGFYGPRSPATSAMLADLRIPFKKVHGIEGFFGDWLICSGLDLEQRPALIKALYEQTRKGARILILPPTTGDLNLIQTEDSELLLSDTRQLRRLNKRYDTTTWGTGMPITPTKIALRSVNQTPSVDLDAASGPWSWLTLRIGKGQLHVCTWDLINHYHQNPTPAYFLRQLLTDSRKSD